MNSSRVGKRGFVGYIHIPRCHDTRKQRDMGMLIVIDYLGETLEARTRSLFCLWSLALGLAGNNLHFPSNPKANLLLPSARKVYPMQSQGGRHARNSRLTRSPIEVVVAACFLSWRHDGLRACVVTFMFSAAGMIGDRCLTRMGVDEIWKSRHSHVTFSRTSHSLPRIR